MSPRRPRRRLVAAAAVLTIAWLGGSASDASARPGGGQSYSSSYHSSSSSSSYHSSSSSSYSSSYRPSSSSWSSSSGGSGGGEPPPGWVMGIVYFFTAIAGLQLVYAVTRMLHAGITGALRERREDSRTAAEILAEMSTRPPAPRREWSSRPRPEGRRGRAQRVRRAAIQEHDPDFSSIVFTDLVRRLYVEAYLAAGHPDDPAALDALAPYLTAAVRGALIGSIVGAKTIAALVAEISVERYQEVADAFQIVVSFTSNLHLEASAGEVQQTIYAVERWTFRRAKGARTRPPAAILALGCPNCGAPFVAGDQRRCAHCGEVVEDGRLEWTAEARNVLEWRSIPPTLTRSVVEVGTDDPTVIDYAAAGHFAAMASLDPSLTRAALDAKIAAIFVALAEGWNAGRPERFRPFVSDALHDTLCYWLRAYARQGLRNHLESAAISRIELCKVERDAYFDAITLRVFAAGLDYTVDALGRLVCGSKTRPRRYSEYWTLIRGRGVVGAPTNEGCPSCAAPLMVTMAGCCDHCGIHLTLGEFDWVLSRIEQDEAYRG